MAYQYYVAGCKEPALRSLFFGPAQMRDMETDNGLEPILTPLLTGLGLSLVELSVARHRGDVKVNLVLFKHGGIGLEDLTRAQKVLRPRLELEFDRENLSVEISSPGTSRVIKHPREYHVFKGLQMSFLIDDEWTSGLLAEVEEGGLLVEVNGRKESVPLDRIRKAKLSQ